MVIKRIASVLLFIPLFFSCNPHKNNFELVVPSPDLKNHIYFNLNDGEPWYLFFVNNDIIIDWSPLGVAIKDQVKFSEGLVFEKSVSTSVPVEDEILFAKGSILRSPYNEMIVFLTKPEEPETKFLVLLRSYNSGFAIGYDFLPAGKNGSIPLTDLTGLNLYSKSVSWTLENRQTSDSAIISSQREDSILLPCSFISGLGYRVELNEPEESDYSGYKLFQPDSQEPEFKFLPGIEKNQFIQFMPGKVMYKLFIVSKNS